MFLCSASASLFNPIPSLFNPIATQMMALAFYPFLFIPLYLLLLFGTSQLKSVLVTQSCLTLCDRMD